MKLVRWLIAALLALYALLSMVTVFGLPVLYKLGLVPAEGPEMTQIRPWLDDVPWWQLALEGVHIALLAAVVWRLVRAQRALTLYLAALVFDVLVFLTMRTGAGYQAAFTAEQQSADYVIFAVLALIGMVLWWDERRRT